MVCPHAYPLTVARKYPEEFARGTSYYEDVVGCKHTHQRCQKEICPEYIFFGPMKLIGHKGYYFDIRQVID